jgi:glutamate transport system permease protein
MRGAIEVRGDIVIPLLLATALVYLVLAVVIGRVFDVLERKLVILR